MSTAISIIFPLSTTTSHFLSVYELSPAGLAASGVQVPSFHHDRPENACRFLPCRWFRFHPLQATGKAPTTFFRYEERTMRGSSLLLPTGKKHCLFFLKYSSPHLPEETTDPFSLDRMRIPRS